MKRTAIAVSLAVLFLAVVIEAHQPTEIMIEGTGVYPADVQAVQFAVDSYDIVNLSGTFNFGQADWATPAGMINISRPNVVLKAAKTNGATILGGGAPAPLAEFADWVWPVISIRASGVTVRGLNMQGSIDTGIFISSAYSKQPTGRTITLEGNTIVVPWAPIFSWWRGGWPLVVRNNELSGIGGLWDVWTALTLDQGGNAVLATSRLDVLNNDITAGFPGTEDVFDDAITVWGWPMSPPDRPTNLPADTIFDNGSVTIAGNTVTITSWNCPAISLGRSHAGLNHCVAANNTIRGKAAWGIIKWPYGHDNSIVGNDLSGLSVGPGFHGDGNMTASAQIEVNAGNTTVANNIIGSVDGPYAVPMLIYSINHHPDPDPLNTPMPLPVEKCTIIGNDYSHSNCP